VISDNVYLYIKSLSNCCVIGFHGAGEVPGKSSGPTHGNGNQPIQTYAWASWMTAGFFNPANSWPLQDINAFSHEISEWADDPFNTNTVQAWRSPIAPQYGCSTLLETGDPVLGVGFSAGVNTFDQNPFTDGTYHPQDEAFLPWFLRFEPNQVSQPVQGGVTGRYTLLGKLNPFPFFHQPATAC